MARNKSTGVEIILVLIALILFIVALSGNASGFLSSILKWLTGGKVGPMIVDKLKSVKADPNGGTGAGGTPAPAPAPAPVPAPAPAPVSSLKPIPKGLQDLLNKQGSKGGFFGGGWSFGIPGLKIPVAVPI